MALFMPKMVIYIFKNVIFCVNIDTLQFSSILFVSREKSVSKDTHF